MNNQQILEIAKACNLVYNNNYDILQFYRRIRKELKKEFDISSINK
jgi:NADH:ubiquinone oxidoreductase subunit E